jgi:hypothetical protein
MITINFTGPDAYIVAQVYLLSLETFKRDETIKAYQEYRYFGTTWSGYSVRVDVINYDIKAIN